MYVLVTGSEGRIGRQTAILLQTNGYQVRTFDRIANPNDDHITGNLLDLSAVKRAVQGVEAVVHAGALPGDRSGTADQVIATNVQGTWHVLQACLETAVKRVVYLSSINALGSVGGYRITNYFPLDDRYPCHPMSPYQLSKYLTEEMCQMFTARYGLATICLRPTLVTLPNASLGFHQADQTTRCQSDYWTYVDIRDVSEAIRRSLEVNGIQHGRYLLAADDSAVIIPTADLIDTQFPNVPWPQIDMETYLAGQPFRSLVDTSHAKTDLGWHPQYTWREIIRE